MEGMGKIGSRCPNCNIWINNTGKKHKRLYDKYGKITDYIECKECGEIFERKITDFKCKRCGECCFNTSMLSWTKEDWLPIIKYIKEKYNGFLTIKCSDRYVKIYIGTYMDIEKIKKEYNYLWEALDEGECPFIKYDYTWLCEIYDIRPMKCREFRCDRDWNIT